MEAPYLGAKEMVLVEETDDRELLARLFAEIYPEPKLSRAAGTKEKSS